MPEAVEDYITKHLLYHSRMLMPVLDYNKQYSCMNLDCKATRLLYSLEKLLILEGSH